jgi:hypothetical protein
VVGHEGPRASQLGHVKQSLHEGKETAQGKADECDAVREGPDEPGMGTHAAGSSAANRV